MSVTREQLIELIEPAVTAMGYELSDLEFAAGSGHGVLRLFIDRDEGIDLDDCEKVSRQVSGLLDVEDPIAANYNLEVSSPGLDRKLVKPEHFDRFTGCTVRIRLRRLVGGRRRFRGELLGRDEDRIRVLSDGEIHEMPLAEIDVARLVPEV